MIGGEFYFASGHPSSFINICLRSLSSGPLPYRSNMFISRAPSHFALFGLLSIFSGVFAQNANTTAPNHTTVLILGGGMTGIIAARTLHEQGIDDFIILDAKTQLGGRMSAKTFGVTGRQVVIEAGPNWVQGTQQGNGPANPIWELALKHNLTTAYSDWYGSVSMYIVLSLGIHTVYLWTLATYDDSGYNNYTDVFNNAINNFAQATVVAGMYVQLSSPSRTPPDGREVAQRLKGGEVDLSLRSAYSFMGTSPKTPQEVASDYYQIDFVSNSCLVHGRVG